MIYKLGSINSSLQGFQSLAEFWSVASGLRNSVLDLDLAGCTLFKPNMASPLGMLSH